MNFRDHPKALVLRLLCLAVTSQESAGHMWGMSPAQSPRKEAPPKGRVIVERGLAFLLCQLFRASRNSPTRRKLRLSKRVPR